MRPISNTYTILASTANGVCLSQTPLSAGSLTIAGGLAFGGSVILATPQHVSISCAGADSGRSFVVAGTEFNGAALTETIAGSAAGITSGTKNFKTITSVTVDAATAGAVTVGILGTLETPWIPLNHYQNPFGYSYSVDVGTATFSVEGTLTDVQDSAATVVPFTVEASGSIDVSSSKTAVVRAVRVKVTAFTSGAITFIVMQAGA